MQHPASQRSPGWADLQPELLQQVAALLGNQDRLSLMHTCGHWYAAIATGPPDLLPAAVLACPPLEVAQLEENEIWHLGTIPYRIRQAVNNDMFNTLSLSIRAGMLPQQTWRVRIEGEVQPMAVVALLMALPPNVRWLELAVTPCAGPLLPALARFTNLQRLDITSNAADIGPIAALALLPQLSLDYRRMPVMNADASVDDSVVEQLPRSAPPALAAATALHNLELRVAWSGDVAALCRGLPALRQLRLHLYNCTNEHASAAVQLLHALPQLEAAALGIHSCPGSDLDRDYPRMVDADEMVALPALAGLTTLTELCLAGWTDLPPDLRKLSHLQRLVLACASDGDANLSWGSEPLSGMTALTHIDLLHAYEGMEPDAALLATAPCLAEVHAADSPAVWRAQLAALRPDLRIA